MPRQHEVARRDLGLDHFYVGSDDPARNTLSFPIGTKGRPHAVTW